MDETTKANLISIKIAVNSFIKQAEAHYRSSPVNLYWAVNWADIGCRRVIKCEDTDGQIWYQAEISEASPDNQGFKDFIYDRLKENRFNNVEIITEW